jgi:polyhydroxyalkanoate synthesis regulator phasin
LSEQRRLRSELRQGLHQFLMSMYMSYTETMGQDEAKEIVLQVIEEEYKYFSPDGMQTKSAKDVLTDKIQELTDKLETIKDFDSQVYYAEKIDALQAALEAFEMKIS